MIDQIERVRADKGFKLLDLIVYGIIAALIAALFIVLAITVQPRELKGVNIKYRGEIVMVCDFEGGKYEIKKPENITVVSEDEDEIKLKFCTEKRGEFNDITVYKTQRKVDVTEANCSTRKDCVYMAEITDTSKFIICTPHALKIEPFGYEGGGDIIIG